MSQLHGYKDNKENIMACTLFGLGSLATLGLVYVGSTVLNVSLSKLFKAGLAKFKGTSFWQAVVRKFPSLG
jgi:hypothetical protein